MKKRILASLLTLCMVFAMIPTIAPMASAAGGDLKINGGVITPNTDVAYGSGTANYDKASSTLTLTNATIELASWAQYGIWSEFPLNIHLVGDNQITGSCQSKAIFIGNGSGSGQSLNITAEAGGSLAINSNGGINCSDLIINSSVTLTINASNTIGIQCGINYTQRAGSNVSVTSASKNGMLIGGRNTNVETGAKFRAEGAAAGLETGAIRAASNTCKFGGVPVADTTVKVLEFDGNMITGAPVVLVVLPIGQDVSTAGNITVTFSKAMKNDVGTATLEEANGSIPVFPTLAGTWSSDGATYTAPYANLKANTSYQVRLKDFQSVDGGVLAETTDQCFITGDALAIYVNGTNIVTEPGNSIQCGAAPENKATYDAATNTLTLTDATIDKTLLSDPGAAGNGIFSNDALNIVLVGNSKIAGTDITFGVLAIDALTLSGSGSLEITTSDDCISSANGDIIFNGGTYNLKTSGESSAGIWGNRVITVGSGVRLTTVSEKSNGMYLSRSGGTITINDGAAVVAKGDNRGINANNGTITVAKNAALLAERTNAVSGAAMDYRTCTLGGVDYPKSNKDPIVNYRNGAFANPLTKLIVNGKNLLDGESVPGVSFNGTDTITLNNATLDTPSIDDEYICAKGDLSIIVQGDNNVMMNPGTTGGEYVYGIAVYKGNLDISGSGKLSILMDTGSDTLVNSAGIYATGSTDSMGNISIKDIELDIKMMSTTDDCAIYGVGNVTLTNTRGTILGAYLAIAMNSPSTVNGMSYDTGYSKLELTPEGFIGSNTLFLLKIGNVDIVKNFEAVENPDLSGIMTRGSYSLDLPNSTLTLNGASIAAVDVHGIQFSGSLTINTTAASDISASGINDACCILGADGGELTLKGGPLTMVGGDLNGGIVLVDILNADAGASATITAGSNLGVQEIYNADGSEAIIPKFGTVTLKDGTFSGESVTPAISVLPTASAITYGETLEKSTLKGGEALYRTYPVEGTFAWKTATEKPAASGLANYKVTFTPDSLGNFNPFDFDVAVLVNKAAGAAITDNIGGSYTGNGTDFTYTVTPIVGAEYKIDSGTWQDSNIFSGIVPASNHTFSARMKADANHEVGAEKSGSAVTFALLDNTTPPSLAYGLSGQIGNITITITPVDDAEYTFDGGSTWGSNNAKNFTTTETVTIGIRTKATATHNASTAATTAVNLAEQSSIIPAAKIDYITVQLTNLGKTEKYRISVGGTDTELVSSDTGTLAIKEEWCAQTISIVKCGNGANIGDSLPQLLPLPALPTAPSAPTIATVTDTSVTLMPTPGMQYQLASGDWQDSSTFTGLTPNTAYTVRQRAKGVADTSFPSAASLSSSFTTEKAPAPTPIADIDYIAENLTGLTASAVYSITPDGGEAATITADAIGNVPIEAAWLGKTLSIIRKADGNTKDSAPQSLAVQARPSAPTNGKVNDDNGVDTFSFTENSGATADKYEYSTDNGKTWKSVTVNPISIGNVTIAIGSLHVRLKATATSFFGTAVLNAEAFTASLSGSVAIGGSAIYGETLTATATGTQSGTVLSYEWKSGDTVLQAKSANNTYKITGADIGKTITVNVSGEGYIGGLTSAPTAAVAKRAVTATAGTVSKEYDGNATATVPLSVSNSINDDVIVVTAPSSVYNDKTVGTGKAITLGALTVTGAAADLYTVTAPANVTGEIKAKTLTVGDGTFMITKSYDGTAAFTAANAEGFLALNDVVSTDSVNVKIDSYGAANDANVGQKTSVLGISLDGADKGNYTVADKYSYTKASIIAKAITPTIEAIAKETYTGSQLTPTVTVKDGATTLTADNYNVTYGANTAVGAKSGSVTVELKGNYGGTANATFEIGKGTATGKAKTFNVVEDTAKSYTFDLSGMLPSVTVPASLGTATYSTTGAAGAVLSGNAAIAGNTITLPIKAAAANTTQDIAITITSENYTIAPVTLTLKVVEKETVTIDGIAAATGLVYNGKAQNGYTGTITVSGNKVPVSELVYAYTSTDGGGYAAATPPTKAGAYKLAISVAKNNENYTGAHSGINFTIGKAPLTVGDGTFMITKSYDGTAAFTAANAEGFLALNDVASTDSVNVKIDSYGAANDANVGQKTSVLGISLDGADKGNYTVADKYSYTKASIIAKAITPTIEAIAKETYTGNKLTPTVTVKDGAATLTADNYNVTYGTNTAVGAKSGSVTVELKGNYNGTANATFEIGKGTAAGKAKTFNVVEDTAKSYTFDLSGMLPSVTVPASLGTVTYSTTGAAGAVLSGNAAIAGNTITLPIKAAAANTTQDIAITITSENYTIAPVTLTLKVVEKETVTIDGIAAATGLVYNGKAQNGYTGTITVSGNKVPVSELVYAYTSTDGGGYAAATPPTKAGAYKLVVSVKRDNEKYTGATTIAFNISKRAIIITAENNEMMIDTAEPVYTATTSNLADGETISGITFSVTDKNTAQKGSYPIVPAGGIISSGNGNYEITYANGILTVKIDVTAIDTVVADANTAKIGVTVSEKPDYAIANGTKFVNQAHLTALNTAIQTATDAKSTVGNASDRDAAITALTRAISTFTAAIKTGTYVSYTDGGGSFNPTPKPEPEPEKGDTNAVIPVKAATTGGISSATVSGKAVSDAIAAAVKEAEKTGGTASLTINVDAPTDAKVVETTLSGKGIASVADGKTDSLKISTPVATVSFDSKALAAISNAAGDDVKISVTQVGTDTLTDAQKQLVGNAPVFDFTITSNGKTISDFGGGSATVTVPYTLKDGENPEFITVWLLDDSGKLVPIEAKYADGKITFTTEHFSRYAIGYLPFTDVTGHWAYENIVYAYKNNLFSGMGNDKFAPANNMTRAMLWSVLYRMAGAPGKTDVALWYADAQKWAINESISDGVNPDGNVTREQLATILYRYAKATAGTADMSGFTDTADISDFAKDGVSWAVANGILNGNGDKLNPQGNATRAEVAAMLQRFAQKQAN